MASYRVLAADLVDNTIREEIAVHDLSWSHVLNAPGAMSGWVSLDDPKATRTNIDPGGTAIYVERGGLLVWGGILWTALADTTTRRLELGAEGFWSYLRKLILFNTRTYTAEDQLTIAQDVITLALGQAGAGLGITVGAETSGVTRDRTYLGNDHKPIGELVEQLAAVQGGFDFSIEVDWDSDGITPLKTVRMYYPRRGARLDGLIWNHNVTGVASFNIPVDAKAMANTVVAVGAGDADDMLRTYDADLSLTSRYPMMWAVRSYKDVVEHATLQGHARADLNRMKFPVETPTIVQQAGTLPNLGSFQVGDEGLVRVKDGWIDVNGYHRVQSIQVDVTDDGQETMTVQFVSADVGI